MYARKKLGIFPFFLLFIDRVNFGNVNKVKPTNYKTLYQTLEPIFFCGKGEKVLEFQNKKEKNPDYLIIHTYSGELMKHIVKINLVKVTKIAIKLTALIIS